MKFCRMTIFAKLAEQSIPDEWVVNLTIEVLSMKNTEQCLILILILSFSVLKSAFCMKNWIKFVFSSLKKSEMWKKKTVN